MMDVEPLEHFHGTRRRMRRPVAAGIPAPALESWLDVVDEEPWQPPALVYVAIGMVGGALILATATFLALAAWWDRTFAKT